MPDLARFARAGAVLCAAALPMALLVSAPAHALSPAAPSGLAPRGSVATATPTFSWHRVASATRYFVQADDDPSFGSPNLNVSTTNTRAVPTSNLPQGEVFWRVRSASSVGQSQWVGSRINVSVTSAAPPTQLTPSGGQVLAQPHDPPLLTWSPIPGAVGYDVEVDSGDVTSADFVGAASLTSPSTSVLVPKPQLFGSWTWHVRAQLGNGLVTQWSSPATYQVQQLEDVQISPTMETGSPIEDAVLDWLPVPGATKYELQVGLDTGFSNLVETKTVSRTSYAPQMSYDNDTYFWRVRAIDASGNKMPWPATPFSFQRNWPEAPTLLHPDDATLDPGTNQLVTTGDDIYYQWTPVPHATRYELQVGSDPNFSPGTFQVCTTAQTTYTAGYLGGIKPPGVAGNASLALDACLPHQGAVTYWRVRALDGPHNPEIEGIYSATYHFLYKTTSSSGSAVTAVSPADGDTVDVPTLTWSDADARKQGMRYLVSIYDLNGAKLLTTTTYAQSWTPDKALAIDKGPFSWRVSALYADGSASPNYFMGTFSLSGNTPSSGMPELTPLTGTAVDDPTVRFPSLSWEPMVGAKTYRVEIGQHDSGFFYDPASSVITKTAYAYSAATNTDTFFQTPGQYDWQVTAYGTGGTWLGQGPIDTFTIKDLDQVSGQRIALDGLALDNGHYCDAQLGTDPTAEQICTGTPATPVLSWEPVPNAAYYAIYLANDRELTNRVFGADQLIPATTSTMWTLHSSLPKEALADNSSAGAYYWYVRACNTPSHCGPDPISINASATDGFRKASPAPALQDPSTVAANQCNDPDPSVPNDSVCSDDITFAWDDYLTTNTDAGFDPTDHSFVGYGGLGTYWPETTPPADGTESPSSQAALSYRIEISASNETEQSGAFTTPLDLFDVDATSYTSHDHTLPEGNLYWHVQAIDADRNRLSWSPIGIVRKDSGVVGLSSPTNSAVKVDGGTAFRWQPQDGAQTYTIEVYRNDDSAHSLANRVFTSTTYQPAYVWSKYLPPSDKPYLWRVQWTDAYNVRGGWSADGHFQVGRATVLQKSPSVGGYQPANGPYVTWQQAHSAATSGGQPTATKYRVEVRRADGGTVMNVTTTALAAAATSAFKDGSYDWQVTAYDQSNGVLGTSPWRTFKVDSTRPTVVRSTPTAGTRVKATANFVATFSEPVRNVSSSTMKLYVKGHTGAILAKVSLSRNKLKATLNPTKNLTHGKSYTVKVTSGIRDLSGLRLVAYKWLLTAK